MFLQVVTQLLEIVRLAAYVLAPPAALFGAFCAVAALVSRIEDRSAEDLKMKTPDTQTPIFNKASETSDHLQDLPKAA